MNDETPSGVVDRRGLMRRGVGAALLALAGGTAASLARESSADAATGDPLIMGQGNSGGLTSVNVSEFVFIGGTAPGPLVFVNPLSGVIPLRLAGAPSD